MKLFFIILLFFININENINISLKLQPIIEYNGNYNINNEIDVILIDGMKKDDIFWKYQGSNSKKIYIKDESLIFPKSGIWIPYYNDIKLDKYIIYIN